MEVLTVVRFPCTRCELVVQAPMNGYATCLGCGERYRVDVLVRAVQVMGSR